MRWFEGWGFKALRRARYIQRRGQITQHRYPSHPYLLLHIYPKRRGQLTGKGSGKTARTYQYEAGRVGSQITQAKLDAPKVAYKLGTQGVAGGGPDIPRFKTRTRSRDAGRSHSTSIPHILAPLSKTPRSVSGERLWENHEDVPMCSGASCGSSWTDERVLSMDSLTAPQTRTEQYT